MNKDFEKLEEFISIFSGNLEAINYLMKNDKFNKPYFREIYFILESIRKSINYDLEEAQKYINSQYKKRKREKNGYKRNYKK